MSDPKWILLFWKFVKDRMGKEKLNPDAIRTKIPCWEVFPVKRREQLHDSESILLDMESSKKAVYYDPKFSPLKLLESLGCWQPDSTDCSVLETLKKFSSSETDFEGLSLVYTTLDFHPLKPQQHVKLLAHFDYLAANLSDAAVERFVSKGFDRPIIFPPCLIRLILS